MKKRILVSLLGLLLCGTIPSVAQDSGKKENPADKWTESRKLSYILGVQLGQLSKSRDLALDVEMITRGLNDFMKGNELAMSPQQIQQFMADYSVKPRKNNWPL